MKGKSCVLGLLLAAAPALANYTSIQHNLINGSPDTAYNAATKQLTWSSSDSNQLKLYDPGPGQLLGTITDAVVSLTTTFRSYDAGERKALFTGGNIALSFKYGGQPYSIGGPISGMVFTTTAANVINCEGLFNAGTPNLPGSGIWDAAGLSSIKGLTISFSGGLPDGLNYAWDEDITGRVETQYTLLPIAGAAPEPVSLVLLAAGGLLLRRRRA